jgi:adenylyl-sulfate kinase
MSTTESACVVWFTGLSGAGKTTIARAVADALRARGRAVELLDGDALRAVIPDGFRREEREAHVRRVGFFASRFEHHGITVVVSLISPYRASRDFARGLCRRFVEVYVSTPLTVCERRDPKGLYARARAGEITGFTGIDDPYEAPRAAELSLDTSSCSVEEAKAAVLARLDERQAEERMAWTT